MFVKKVSRGRGQRVSGMRVQRLELDRALTVGPTDVAERFVVRLPISE